MSDRPAVGVCRQLVPVWVLFEAMVVVAIARGEERIRPDFIGSTDNATVIAEFQRKRWASWRVRRGNRRVVVVVTAAAGGRVAASVGGGGHAAWLHAGRDELPGAGAAR